MSTATQDRPAESAPEKNEKAAPFAVPPLPYAHDALAARGMGEQTLRLHHDLHHKAYVDKVNEIVAGNPSLQGKTLEDLVGLSHANPEMAALFNNAGQHYNHTLFWSMMSPEGGKLPGILEKKIGEDFGGVAQFKEAFKAAAVGQFGSGWAWLVQDPTGRLKVAKTANGSNPFATGEGTALLGIDVWEHSYYLDFQNKRPAYVENWLEKLANYEFAAARLK